MKIEWEMSKTGPYSIMALPWVEFTARVPVW